jgi:hypothetical protein
MNKNLNLSGDITLMTMWHTFEEHGEFIIGIDDIAKKEALNSTVIMKFQR